MSAFINANGASTVSVPIIPGVNANDDAIQPVDYRTSPPLMAAWGNQLRDTDILWPRANFPGQNSPQGCQNGVVDGTHQYWEWNFPPTGLHRRKIVSGVVRDSSGNPISGATVKLINTATGTQVDSGTSAGDGSYALGDPNAVNCFVVGDLAGSPETEGTTVQNLTGT